MKQEVINLINYNTVKTLSYGNSLLIGDDYELYHYSNEKHIVLINRTTELEEYCILLDDENKTLVFETL